MPASSSIVLVAVVAAACTPAGTPSAAGPSPSAPPATDPGASADLGPVIDPDALVADPAALDGQMVQVRGFFLARDGIAELCSVVLESYPPQCGGGTVRLTGEVPADILDALDRTTEPDLAQATWGYVVVTGTFRAAGAAGAPTLEISAIEIAAP